MHRPEPTQAGQEQIGARSEELFFEQRQRIDRFIDNLLVLLLVVEWFVGFFMALRLASGTWVALILAGVFLGFAGAFALVRPGTVGSRHTLAVAQMLLGALLIHLSGGRTEAHFHIFVSLAVLAFYLDWRVLVSATVVVVVDHLVGGIVWPQSGYGVEVGSVYRTLEHAGWVLFEDVFLILCILQAVWEMRKSALRQAELEATQARLELTIAEQTAAPAKQAERDRELSRQIGLPDDSTAPSAPIEPPGGPVLDWQAALAQMDGDKHLLAEVVRIFQKEGPILLEKAQKAISQGDAAGLRRAAHSLKGSVSYFVAASVVEAARNLEGIGASGDLSGAAAAWQALEQEVGRLLGALAATAAQPGV